MPYYGSRTEHSLDDSPLDLAPRRLIAPRRRLRELSTDHTIYRAPNVIVNNEITEDSINRVMASMHAINSDVEQPESPPVIKFYKNNVYKFNLQINNINK